VPVLFKKLSCYEKAFFINALRVFILACKCKGKWISPGPVCCKYVAEEWSEAKDIIWNGSKDKKNYWYKFDKDWSLRVTGREQCKLTATILFQMLNIEHLFNIEHFLF
jgi:hypothetical protein